MTIRIGNYEIVIFKVTVKESVKLVIDQEARQRDTEAIKSSDSFKALQETARIMRAKRNGVIA